MGEREPGRQLDLRDPYVAADLCGAVRVEHSWFELSCAHPVRSRSRRREAYPPMSSPRRRGPIRREREMRHGLDQSGIQWLWVPAFAGTTGGNASPVRHAFFRGNDRQNGREFASATAPWLLLLALTTGGALTIS